MLSLTAGWLFMRQERRLLRLPLADAISNPAIEVAISKIASSSYVNYEVILSQELEKNTEIYLSLSKDEDVEAFFMVGWSTLRLHGQSIDCVFLGLSATTPAKKGGGLAISLYRRFLHDAVQTATLRRQAVAWWFHTASPIVAGVMWHLVDDIGPTPDGFLSSDHLDLLAAIQERYNFAAFKDQHIPCVLRRFAQARYSPAEVERLNARKEKTNTLLGRWQIDETVGDRVLFVGKCLPRSLVR
jgi:hypothetical protein